MDSYTTNAKAKENSLFTYQTLGNVTGFLKELNLQQYVAAFIDEGFESLSAIREITEEDLIALNVKRGHRRVIQRGIATLNGIPKTQPLIVVAPASSFTTLQQQPCLDIVHTKSVDNNSSEGSAYNNSGYGSMNSSRHVSSTAQKYDSSNSSQYASNPQHTHPDLMLDPQSETQSSNDDTASKNVVSAIEGSRSSFSSNDDEEENDADSNMDLPIKRKYRRHPKPDKNAPIKPPSAYIMFSNDARAQLKDHNMTFVEIAKLVGDQWKNLGVNLKHQYERTAMRAKDEYIDALNAYRQTNEYKNYQTYLNNFKSEQDATNRRIARLRKKAKRDSPGSDASLGSCHSTDADNPRSSSSSGSSDIYKVHLKNNPPAKNNNSSSGTGSDEGSTTRNSNSPDDILTTSQLSRQEMEEDNNGGECYSPQQNPPPFVSDSLVESNYHRLPFTDKTAAA
ncbi:hypothetical protein EDC94DRAFT_618785 [Helicostylum pulchrum]|nr:hypothetical protein EDC94DRAFT_618785 [Helicostylum pulchrum]